MLKLSNIRHHFKCGMGLPGVLHVSCALPEDGSRFLAAKIKRPPYFYLKIIANVRNFASHNQP